ncbi:hypothetical protein [Lysinibacillus fusiformis]|uniref:hypothetical protein n=1 Tax=Lysinibacillus fusiformis TaxID=28031 RepID=UPI00088667DE|nr:hypothetical protein [Lysinibacillus fusiformis]SCX52097.1 hypothetical protein SAMN02787108_01868 [Lysinibacillus fusiformis]SDB27696.1 hypothetical protein SAMN02787070_01994 [Lysinibacillus fusiformis]SFI21864.1 hypothetical protein SAMN02787080_01993 [Lysinibacillus fusiformis]SFS82098.1 hypothetical protein SAMN02787099_01728 [Lysinibacillus fusiformis]
MIKEELVKTKEEIRFIYKLFFIIAISISVMLFILFWTMITIENYLGMFGDTVDKVSPVIATFLIPPILSYVTHRYFFAYFFRDYYISKLSLIKIKNFFSNSSLVLIGVLSTTKTFFSDKKFEGDPPDRPNFLNEPIEYIEYFSVLILHPVNSTYTLPLVFAVISFLFSFLETSNFATYSIYIPKGKITYITYPNENTKDYINHILEIELEIKNYLKQMKSELNNFKIIHN